MGKRGYAGLFLVSMATLMYEILLTRIFSVTMWYHFAFMAISVAMFGMTFGAILVYLCPRRFTPERAKVHLGRSALAFALAIVVSSLVHLSVPIRTDMSLLAFGGLAFTYVVVAIPFVFSGVCMCLVLTKFPAQVSKLYAADLGGAALGCILLIYVLRITDGPTAVFAVASFAAAAAVLFAAEARSRALRRNAMLACITLAAFTVAHTVLVRMQRPIVRVAWAKNTPQPRPLYEKWNSFSRIMVFGDPDRLQAPFGWGLSPTCPTRPVRRLHLNIDADAGTPLLRYRGDPRTLEHLKYDITNLAHYLRSGARVLAVGSGGGRDILSALAFKQKAVVGVEINGDIVRAVNDVYGAFTGHLDRDPRVTFVVDEARSWIARQKDKYDILQVSLIDTFAATAAGAFVLSENSLYTVEAWRIFLDRLAPRGILTFSRWYNSRRRPREMYRLTSLAVAALKQIGVQNPRDHIIVVGLLPPKLGLRGVGTIMVSPQPFSPQDVAQAEAIAKDLQFSVMLSPRGAADPTFAMLASGQDLREFYAQFPLNITPPTDDSPFFFNMLRLGDMFSGEPWSQADVRPNLKAVVILGVLLMIVLGLTALCIIVPLALTTRRSALRGASPHFVYFACIGFGFMLIEISQMQRLIIFLGHPTYGLSVVLFALLLSSGLGSLSTQKVPPSGLARSAAIRFSLLLCVLVVFGVLTPRIVHACQTATTPARILIATALLFPLGFLMGMPFPLGMKLSSHRSPAVTPWLWGINGAASVCASVLAIAIALNSGISASFWAGVTCYLVATLAFLWATRRQSTQPAPHH